MHASGKAEAARSKPAWPSQPSLTLRDRIAAWRNRLVAAPRFQRFSAGFVLTRPIARRQSQALFDLCAGFVYAQILAACVELDLFRILERGPQTSARLAPVLGLEPEATERLLKAATALKLVEPRGGDRHGLAMLGAALLGNPGAGSMIAHHRLLYRDLAEPLALLRGAAGPTELSRFWTYAAATPAAAAEAEVAPYSELMGASHHLVADDLLAAYDFGAHRHVLDIGGGDGAFLVRLARQAPALEMTLFDLPAVAERARARFAAAGLASRTRAIGGDMHRDRLASDADLVTLLRVLHDHDDEAARALLARIRAAVRRGATLLIAEPMAGPPGTERMADAYFGLYLLAMGRGRVRRQDEIGLMLTEAGFGTIRPLRMRRPLLVSAMVAQAA